MAKMKKGDLQKNFMVGALGGAIIYAFLWLINAMNVPQLQVTFSTIEVPLREQLLQAPSTIGQGLIDLIGGAFAVPALLISAVGMGLIYVLGATIVNNLNIKMGKLGKVTTIIAVGGVVAGWIISLNLAIPVGSSLVVLAVVSFVTAWLLVFMEQQKLIKIPN